MTDLDRTITLTVSAPTTTDEHGEPVQGDITFQGKVWARYLTGGQDLTFDPPIVFSEHDRRFRIRWRSDVVTVRTSQLAITDDLSQSYTVSRIQTVDERGRRRFLELECSRQG